MQIETLRIFCDLVELRSFSRAAEKHFISQSAVSQQLAQLETTYKRQLLDRKKRPFELTAAGQLFYNTAKDILNRYEQMTSDLNNLNESSGTVIDVAAIFSIGMHTLQPYVKKFMKRYPNVNIRIEYQSSRRIYDRILRGNLDIGLVAVPKKDRNIELYPFEPEPLVLVCSQENLLANQTHIDIHDLQLKDFIAFEKDLPTRILIDDILRRYNVTVRNVMEFDNIETIKQAVEINAGLSILPLPALHTELANETLRSLSFSNENFSRPTGIIVRKNRVLAEAGRYLIELLRKNVSI